MEKREQCHGEKSEGHAYLDTEITSVHIIAQEKISRVLGVSSNLKELHQVVILSVHITAHRDRGVHFKQVGLGPEDLGGARKNKQGLLLSKATLAIKVLLQEGEVRLRPIVGVVELLVGGLVESGSLDVWDGEANASTIAKF